MELNIKDIIVTKLEWQVGEYKDQMSKAIKIMKVPRLMEIASQQLNYDKVEITKVRTWTKSASLNKRKNPGEN